MLSLSDSLSVCRAYLCLSASVIHLTSCGHVFLQTRTSLCRCTWRLRITLTPSQETLSPKLKAPNFLTRLEKSSHNPFLISEADWSCLHLGNARWAGRVEVKKRSFSHEKRWFQFFYDFARAGPVGWKVIWKLPGPVFKPSRSLPNMSFIWRSFVLSVDEFPCRALKSVNIWLASLG